MTIRIRNLEESHELPDDGKLQFAEIPSGFSFCSINVYENIYVQYVVSLIFNEFMVIGEFQ